MGLGSRLRSLANHRQVPPQRLTWPGMVTQAGRTWLEVSGSACWVLGLCQSGDLPWNIHSSSLTQGQRLAPGSTQDEQEHSLWTTLPGSHCCCKSQTRQSLKGPDSLSRKNGMHGTVLSLEAAFPSKLSLDSCANLRQFIGLCNPGLLSVKCGY